MREIIKNKKISFGQRWCIFLIAGLVATLVLFNSPNFALNSVVFGYGGGGGYQLPSLTPPAGGFNIVINNGTAETESRNVTLVLNGGPDATKMVISNFSDFRYAQSKIYQTTQVWILSEGEDQKNVYVKFYNKWDQSSNVVSDSINLVVSPPKSPLSSEAQRVDANKDNKIDIFDFNILIVNWGTVVSGNVADFNGDGVVDLFDLNSLMIYWIG
ncbi:MAG: hypothetical protein NT012_03600 [Candidatus Nealsonbacteria bacterium]|nr:hypothetical protein [Candidatus Nealsonbacteria bacterium]